MRTDGEPCTANKIGPAQILDRNSLRWLTVLSDPNQICLIESRHQHSMRVCPSLNRFVGVGAKDRCLCCVVRRESPKLPLPVLVIEIGNTRIVGRPYWIAHVTAKQFLYAVQVVVVFSDGANRSLFAREEQLLSVVGRR